MESYYLLQDDSTAIIIILLIIIILNRQSMVLLPFFDSWITHCLGSSFLDHPSSRLRMAKWKRRLGFMVGWIMVE